MQNSKVFLFEKINPLNLRKIKSYRSPVNYDLANKFYIYNGGIHQIVMARKVGFDDGLFLMIQKPSGKYTEFTTEESYFRKRVIYNSFIDAVEALVNISQMDDTKIPLFRKEYVKRLAELFSDELFIRGI